MTHVISTPILVVYKPQQFSSVNTKEKFDWIAQQGLLLYELFLPMR